MDVDERAVADLYRRVAPLVYARARRMIGDSDAEDVVQEVFTRLVAKPPPAERLQPWVYRVSTNLCVDLLRRRLRRGERWRHDLQETAGRLVGDGDVETALANRQFLRRLLLDANPRTREIVALVHFDGLSQTDAAKVLGLSRRTVIDHLQKVQKRAAEIMEAGS